MPQFMVICRMKDPLDPELQKKRLEIRPAHIVGASKLQAEGHLLLGGMVQDKAGNPAGSGCICDFESEEALWEWLNNDPWMVGGVWDTIEVIPFKVAEHYLKH
ncbi:YciI family protein [Pseudochelatococcus sp. G4_1912]|uniref:YciI family protein n=1 Tax=Pseudochelatococcus sp. G4_1912 TaxID=3114288 RepID=UPI0039C75ED3